METKEICINILKKLNIYKPYIKDFKSTNEKNMLFRELCRVLGVSRGRNRKENERD